MDPLSDTPAPPVIEVTDATLISLSVTPCALTGWFVVKSVP